MAEQLDELKTSIQKIAAEQGKTQVQVITELQAAAALTENEKLLDDLCELKWYYLDN